MFIFQYRVRVKVRELPGNNGLHRVNKQLEGELTYCGCTCYVICMYSFESCRSVCPHNVLVTDSDRRTAINSQIGKWGYTIVYDSCNAPPIKLANWNCLLYNTDYIVFFLQRLFMIHGQTAQRSDSNRI